MPKIMDMQLLQAASMASSHPWDTLQGNFKSAQESFMGNIEARQQADAGLSNALSPIFSAASGVLTGGIQNVMGGKSFFNPGTLFNPAQQASAAGPFVGPTMNELTGTMVYRPGT